MDTTTQDALQALRTGMAGVDQHLPQPATPTAMMQVAAMAALHQLYSQLPSVACKGLCHDSCTIVHASQLERDILATHQITLSEKPPTLVMAQAQAEGRIGEKCPALNAFGRCSVYRDRPFVCRAFGAVSHPAVTGDARFEQAMMCDHGCEPEFTISVPEFMDIMSRIEALSRSVTGVARQPIPGDSPRLLGMFRRDQMTERSGFEVDPKDINRHVSEPPSRGRGARGARARRGRRTRR